MNIFGRRWNEKDVVGVQYDRGFLSDGTPCYFHNLIWYYCDLCKKQYFHWLCADQAWRGLPPELHEKLLCEHCFLAMREYMKIRKRYLKKSLNKS